MRQLIDKIAYKLERTRRRRGIVGYWNFDETSGTTAADSSGNNNAGTLVNSPSWIAGKVNNGLSLSIHGVLNDCA